MGAGAEHDAFWAYRKSLKAFVGPGEGEALDVGCGEGRVSRELKACAIGSRRRTCPGIGERGKEARSADDSPSHRGPIYRSRTPTLISSLPITC